MGSAALGRHGPVRPVLLRQPGLFRHEAADGFPSSNPATRGFRFDPTQMAFDVGSSTARAQSLASHFPLTATGMLASDANKTPGDYGLLPVDTDLGHDAVHDALVRAQLRPEPGQRGRAGRPGRAGRLAGGGLVARACPACRSSVGLKLPGSERGEERADRRGRAEDHHVRRHADLRRSRVPAQIQRHRALAVRQVPAARGLVRHLRLRRPRPSCWRQLTRLVRRLQEGPTHRTVTREDSLTQNPAGGPPVLLTPATPAAAASTTTVEGSIALTVAGHIYTLTRDARRRPDRRVPRRLRPGDQSRNGRRHRARRSPPR